MDWKNQYSENEYTTQSNLQIQCNPYQATSDIFHRTRKIISRFVWKYKKPRIAKAILRKKNGTGGINLWYQNIPQSYSHQDSMVLAQGQKYKSMKYKYKYKSMKQNRKPRDNYMHLQTVAQIMNSLLPNSELN